MGLFFLKKKFQRGSNEILSIFLLKSNNLELGVIVQL